MRRLRKLIYWLGFRPKYPSIFFSPSEHVIREVGPAAKQGLLDGFKSAQADMGAFYRYTSAIDEVDCKDSTCNYLEPHKHGFACDVTCKTCIHLTKGEV